jgi:hypothetical protein
LPLAATGIPICLVLALVAFALQSGQLPRQRDRGLSSPSLPSGLGLPHSPINLPWGLGSLSDLTVSNVAVTNVEDGGATITWTTSDATSSVVSYGLTPSHGASSTPDATFVTSHSVVLGGLTPSSTYYFAVGGVDANGTGVASSASTFTTLAASSTAATQGEWGDLLQWPLVDVHTNVLASGELLMWDAWEYNGTASARVWNPSTQAFRSVPDPYSNMFCGDQTMLSDGRILVVGGHNGPNIGIPNVVIYDPRAQSWTRVADMGYPRWYPTVVGLPNGQAIALGGGISVGNYVTIPELYDPVANTWTSLPGANFFLGNYPKTFVLPNGTLFWDGATSPNGESKILDVNAQTWTDVAPNPTVRGTTTMYLPGKVLISGGGTNPVQTGSWTIDLTQPNPTWQSAGSMNFPRFLHNLVTLPDGKVLAVGGSTINSLESTQGVLAAEEWDPATRTWTTLAAQHDLRLYHSTGVLLPDGRVLAAGGGRNTSTVVNYLTAQIYSPPYLFNGPRPTITSAPSGVPYDQTIQVTSPDAASIGSVSLIRLGSDTHDGNTDQRFIPLSFTTGTNALSIQGPSDANVAPPGYYMLFIVNGNGVPSVSAIVQVGPSVAVPTPTATSTSTPTVTPSSTSTPTATATPTSTPTATPVALLGDAAIESSAVSPLPGVAEAFQFSAGASGTVNTLNVYVENSSLGRSIAIGLYTNSLSNDPDRLIAKAIVKAATPGSWNSVAIFATKISAGQTYWIAVLSPSSGRNATFRDAMGSGRVELNSQTGLAALPLTWSAGTVTTGAPLSAYASP